MKGHAGGLRVLTALVEAGAGIRAVLHGESVDCTHDRQRNRDGDESDRVTIIGDCAPSL
jgi:hypothetical protein